MKLLDFSTIKKKMSNLKNSNKKVLLTGIAFVVIALMLVISIYVPKSAKNSAKSDGGTSQKILITDYAASIENKLSSMLMQMESINKVSAFVMIDSTPEIKYLTETEEVTTTNKDGEITTSTKSTTVVFEKNGSISTPVVVTTIMPKVTGVLIVVNNISASTKYNIVRAISVVLNIEESCINILQES